MDEIILCGYCGGENAPGAEQCAECGRELAARPRAAQTRRIAAETVVVGPAATGGGVGLCDYCGTANPAGAAVCAECRRPLGAAAGAPRPATATEAACPTCGRPNPTGVRFCRHCGRALGVGQPAAAPLFPAAPAVGAFPGTAPTEAAGDDRLKFFVAASGAVFLLSGIIYMLLAMLGG